MAHGGHGPFRHFLGELFTVEYWGDWGVSRAFMLGIVFFGLYLILGNFIPNLPLFTFNWLVGTAPIWMPVAILIGAWKAWITYIQSLYLSGRQPVLLEMKIPREVARSPRAMELALTALNLSSGETTFFHRAWKGQVRPFFSFEIVSFGGEIHFYIWCWKNYKDTIEAMMYAHYPEIELVEVEDYAMKFQFDPEKHRAWGVEWPLMSYMKGLNFTFEINAYQPRTYIDFELDKDPKEEFKIDPLANILEFMSSIKPNEQLWIQIVLRKSGKQYILNPLGLPDEDNLWKAMVENEVNKLRAEAAIIPGATLKEVLAAHGEEEDKHVSPRPSWKQNEMMKAMERHLGKYPFQVGMRGIYWAEGDLRGPIYTGFRWIWRPFGNPQYGTHLRPRKWHCDFDYPWQDIHDYRWTNQTYRVHDAYRRRSFFNSPWILPTNVLTNETIASLWHPPSRATATPGIQRMPATKSEPPANLPK